MVTLCSVIFTTDFPSNVLVPGYDLGSSFDALFELINIVNDLELPFRIQMHVVASGYKRLEQTTKSISV